MSVLEFKKRSNFAAWKREIESYQCSGLSLHEWCVKTGITEQQYYYRLRRVREYLIDEVEKKSTTVSLMKYSLADNNVSSEVSESECHSDHRIIVRYGELTVSFPETTNISLLARFMKELAQ